MKLETNDARSPEHNVQASNNDNLQSFRAGDSNHPQSSGAAPAGQSLEQQKILPTVEISGKKEWTVAVALAATLPAGKDNPLGMGADHQSAELKKLAQETEGKSVNFMVHVERTTDAHGRFCLPGTSKNEEKTMACVNEANEKGRATTERYFVHDGKIDKMPDKKYKNGAEDLKELLQEAGQKSPSEKIGLVIQSHGDGAKGIEMTRGKLSLDKTISTIKDGLKGSGHDELDVLDFNSCVMAQASAIGKFDGVTKNIVASAAEEGTNHEHDGQNMSAAMRALMDNPKMSGKEWGEKIVDQAAHGANGVGKENTVTTLANFDMSRHKDFVRSMDDFGKTLQAVGKNPDDIKVLQGAIDRSDIPMSGMPKPLAHDRDLKSFARNVLEDIKAGKFKGDTTDLQKKASDFVGSIDKFASAQYGDAFAGNGNSAGLLASMPGHEVFNKKDVLAELSPMRRVAESLKETRDQLQNFNDKPMVMGAAGDVIENLQPRWAPNHQRAMDEFGRSTDAVEGARNFTQLKAATQHMIDTAERLDRGPDGAQSRRELANKAGTVQAEIMLRKETSVTQGWDDFITQTKKVGFGK